MPIARCPGCQASLEIPAVVPGGLVACPYCGEEFPARPRPAAGRRRPGRPRGRRGAEEFEEAGYRGRGGYRRRTDPVPIVVGVVAVLVIGGVIAFFATKGGRDRARLEEERLAEIARIPPVVFEMSRSPDHPDGEPFDLVCRFHEGDRVTITHLSVTSTLAPPKELGAAGGLLGFTADLSTGEGGERITSADEGGATHEGTYRIKSYIWNHQPILEAETEIGATFRTDRRGDLVPGSFTQTSGPALSPPPEFLGVRGFGVLPDHPIRHKETWGTATLPNPFAGRILVDGRPLESLGLRGARQGGWRFETGDLIRREDGSWTHEAKIELGLLAVENRFARGLTFRGEPAEISSALSWKGKAFYLLQKGILSQVDIDVNLGVRVKTDTAVYDWTGQSSTSYAMYKDP